MSYTILAVGTPDEVRAQLAGHTTNTSPEMPLVLDFLESLVDEVHDNNRIFLDASGYHSGGYVQHKIDFRTVAMPVGTPVSEARLAAALVDGASE